MTETSLYRKYRPQNFSEVLGQEHITDTLAQSIKNNSFSHAYLFSGSRGTGKTSVARILAREIGTKPHDLYEIDAASNRGIDDIRELREAVRALPYDSPYKVYIIDEVHMLTKDAFNALLKTLEEPPAHVVFVLATTEPGKVPETIVSRCSVFQFKQPNVDILRSTTVDIAKKEGVELEPSSAELIAILGDGSYRDTLSVLQKVISARTGKKMKAEEVEKLLGAPKLTLLKDFLHHYSEGDTSGTLEVVEKIKDAGVDVHLFLRLLLSRIRAILLLRYGNDFLKKELAKQFSEEELSYLSELAKDAKNIHSLTLRDFLEIEPQIALSSIKTLPIEILLLQKGENTERAQEK
ncbi:MAG: DNA polymerase III subunit gamma/tau [Candidatus Campbellbacteria bacterium]|nr:DNA polymerase III subunit gamma/tau [Candidatus Campbellbacteria bacterium]